MPIAVDRKRGHPRPAWQHARCERIEALRVSASSPATPGGAIQTSHGIARRFLHCLPAPDDGPSTLRLSFDELWARLEHGRCAVLDGNPIKVTDPGSPLRSMQAKDAYDHAVFIHTAKGDRAFVMDPLGRGRYDGRWVPKADLRQFASRFTTPRLAVCAVAARAGIRVGECVDDATRPHPARDAINERRTTRTLRTTRLARRPSRYRSREVERSVSVGLYGRGDRSADTPASAARAPPVGCGQANVAGTTILLGEHRRPRRIRPDRRVLFRPTYGRRVEAFFAIVAGEDPVPVRLPPPSARGSCAGTAPRHRTARPAA
jgi:hypothetical protein